MRSALSQALVNTEIAFEEENPGERYNPQNCGAKRDEERRMCRTERGVFGSAVAVPSCRLHGVLRRKGIHLMIIKPRPSTRHRSRKIQPKHPSTAQG